ncbi:hypothetical protein HY571_02370 [Candidatus Micrarchaeota archaeon]|nr:hypothetical protein [Candidatus Micrarchaeota archaeon]
MAELMEKQSGDELNTADIQRVAQVEASIQKQLEKAGEKADSITLHAKEEAEAIIEKARQEAAVIKTREIERVRREEIENNKAVIKKAREEAAAIAALQTESVSEKLFQEFKQLIKGR